jgi:hypothetical protein
MLEAFGFRPPWFQFVWQEGAHGWQGEDVRFSLMCRDAGLPVYVDTGLVCPHLTYANIGQAEWEEWLADHPERRVRSDG